METEKHANKNICMWDSAAITANISAVSDVTQSNSEPALETSKQFARQPNESVHFARSSSAEGSLSSRLHWSCSSMWGICSQNGD